MGSLNVGQYPCIHRGGQLRTEICQICGMNRKPIPIYACKVHGECTVSRWRDRKYKDDKFCVKCKQRVEPATPPPPAVFKPPGAASPALVVMDTDMAKNPVKGRGLFPPIATKKERLILSCRLSPGDVLTVTAAVKSLHDTYPDKYLTDVRTPTAAIWENNPHITKIEDSQGRLIELAYSLIHQSNQRAVHFLEGYTRNLGEQLGVSLALTTNRPHLYLSDQEKTWTNQVSETFADPLRGRSLPFWLLDAGTKKDFTCKQWPVEYYQEVVDRTRGRLQWVQVGAAEHDHPRIAGSLDLRGKTTHRQLIRLAWHARGGLGPSTYLQHIMAAFEKPYLCLLGGREPVPWVQYPCQSTFHTIGCLPCCLRGACWKSRVVPLNDGNNKDSCLCQFPVLGGSRPTPKCMAMIRPEEVLTVLGRLE